MCKQFMFLLVLIAAGQVSATAPEQSLAAKGGAVEILAVGSPSFIKIHGKGSPPTGSLTVAGEKVTGRFEFDLTSIDTGIETRNEHMKKKYLEVEKFPTAILVLQNVQPLKNWSSRNPLLAAADFSGTLTLHGATHAISGKVSIGKAGNVDAHFTVNLSQFQVEIPRFAGITIADEVQITVSIARLENSPAPKINDVVKE